ncbi:hypothetical protein HELRODRAFT_174420 [Helobdella robusta]|uniref:Endonuclease/exonuclease/phosphatase domain-containing protein n=1 Tax=Helobdella robusta TaxID=6412 RepID=T1F839_HELRO|nr:hypothetical protein HELRODRAFT_174420 [Helobdella robusta]ESO02944.1 hypothetical protein HELRODRAFT_174420 [Helobdella robusta]
MFIKGLVGKLCFASSEHGNVWLCSKHTNISLKRKNINKRQAMLKCGLLNVRSAVNKALLLNKVIRANNLNVFIITKIWVPYDAPNAIKYGLTPEEYTILHCHRGSSQNKSGGGLAIVHSNLLKATFIVDDMKYLGFENLTVKFNTYSYSFIISSIYRPPGYVSTDLINEFSDHVDTITNFNIPFIVFGDFNALEQLRVIE